MENRIVKFIELKVTEKLIDRDYFEVAEYNSMMRENHEVSINPMRIKHDSNVKTHILPIVTLHETGKPNIHIVYSDEVSNLLEKPINLIVNENKAHINNLHEAEIERTSLVRQIDDIMDNTNTFWKRLKVLFKPNTMFGKSS